MPDSIYIKAMHPKAEIRPTRHAIEKILAAGWVGQMKVHGHRAQIHISADPSKKTLVYNRNGRPHKKLLSEEIVHELRRVLDLEMGWTVLDAEWIKPEEKLFLFDMLKENDLMLRKLSYADRYKLLPRLYLSKYIQTLPLLTSVEKCLEVLARPEKFVEGLVFKAAGSRGFEDSSIIRCRKAGGL